MFLMKSPPLVTLQRKWEPFSTSRSCRYPICFSESEDDIARTTVSAKVQKIINNLQSDESSLGASDEYGHIAQKKRKVATSRGHKLRGGGQVVQECMAYGQHHCPADSDGMEVEESSEFGPFLLHSDSDDSVDQDIEEAIQEYLRNKGQGVQHLPGDAESFHGTDGDQRFQQHETCDLFPPNIKAGVVEQHLDPDYLGDDTIEWATSPCSTSSDDSFEQSIKAEIEKFLNDKKQQEREMNLMRESKRLDPKEAPMSLALKSQKEGGLHRSSLKRGGKALFPRQLPEPQSSGAPLKCLQPEQPANLKKASHVHSRTAVAGRSSNLEQGREGMIRETQKVQNAVISDSSSDDGIEEAIQLYQLEKFKKEANSQLSAFQKDTFQAGVANVSTSLTLEKSALPGAPRKGRGKQLASKPVEMSRFGAASGEPGRCGVPAANRCASYAVTFQASCRADTVAELMCAEAILDISKTVLTPTTVSDDKSLAMNPLHTQSSPPSQQASDNNIVDSDDSIEQEIQAFLAAKAQAECLAATSKENRRTIQSPPFSDQPREQSRCPNQSVLRTRRLSLSHRKKKQTSDKLSEVRCSLDNPSKVASQSQDAAIILKMGKTRNFDAFQWDTLATVSSADFANPLSPGLGCTERRAKMAARASQKYSTGDKSSSLDSDEDLDTAIKDLLRSKRKLRKKPKDHRVQCKKKVTFGDMEMHILQPHGGCKSGVAPLLKSCLTRSQIDTREERTKPQPQTVVKGKPKSATGIPLALECKKEGQPKSVLGSDIRDACKSSQRPWPTTSLTDDSSSVDSDDSIEQEIRKFLAEKATEANRTVKPLRGTKAQTSSLKARCQPRQANAFSKWRGKVPKVGPPTAELKNLAGDSPREGERTVAHLGNQTPGKLQTVQAMGANLPAKRPAVDHLPISENKLARRSLHNYVKPFKRKKKCGFKISNKFIAGLKSARNKKVIVQVGKRQGLQAVKREVGNSATSRFGEKCAMALQNGVPGCRNEAGMNETDPERFQPCSPESPKEIQPHNKALSLTTENPAGRPELPDAEASQGHPLQVPDTGSIREAKASTGYLEATIEEEEGRSRRPSISWEPCSIPSSLSCLPLKENAFTSPDRLAEKQGQDVLEGGSPEFTKLNPCLLKSNPSSL